MLWFVGCFLDLPKRFYNHPENQSRTAKNRWRSVIIGPKRKLSLRVSITKTYQYPIPSLGMFVGTRQSPVSSLAALCSNFLQETMFMVRNTHELNHPHHPTLLPRKGRKIPAKSFRRVRKGNFFKIFEIFFYFFVHSLGEIIVFFFIISITTTSREFLGALGALPGNSALFFRASQYIFRGPRNMLPRHPHKVPTQVSGGRRIRFQKCLRPIFKVTSGRLPSSICCGTLIKGLVFAKDSRISGGFPTVGLEKLRKRKCVQKGRDHRFAEATKTNYLDDDA